MHPDFVEQERNRVKYSREARISLRKKNRRRFLFGKRYQSEFQSGSYLKREQDMETAASRREVCGRLVWHKVFIKMMNRLPASQQFVTFTHQVKKEKLWETNKQDHSGVLVAHL